MCCLVFYFLVLSCLMLCCVNLYLVVLCGVVVLFILILILSSRSLWPCLLVLGFGLVSSFFFLASSLSCLCLALSLLIPCVVRSVYLCPFVSVPVALLVSGLGVWFFLPCLSCLVFVLSYRVLSCISLSCLVLCCLVLAYLVLSLVPSRLALSGSCLVLSSQFCSSLV